MKVEIYSEIAPLKSVILHKPGEEHFFINPNNLNEWIPGKNKLINNPDYLLFDDLINPQKAMEEHDLLSKVIKKFTGDKNCIEFTNLVLDILHDLGLRKALLKECLTLAYAARCNTISGLCPCINSSRKTWSIKSP